MTDQRRTVLITGCAPGGIGNSLAREFHSNGLRVFATARSVDQLTDLATLGIETLKLQVDKTDDIEAAKQEISRRTGGRLDFLVNNAGRNYTVPSLEIDDEELQLTFEVNVFSVMRMCKAFTPLLIEAKGTIVQIGSLAAIMPYVFSPVYNATKAALHAYSNTLRVELKPFGVSVTTIVTGGVSSRIARTERSLLPDSLYSPITAEYERRLKVSQQNAMSNEAYAASVVRQLLPNARRREIWEGHFAWVIYFASNFLPAWCMDAVFYRMFGLSKLANARTLARAKAD